MTEPISVANDSVVEDSHFDVLTKKYMEVAKEVPDDEYESQQKSLVETVVAHRTAKHSAEDDPKKDTDWRSRMNDQSLLCLTRKAWKTKLSPEDYSVVHEFANFFKHKLRNENRSGFGAYRLYESSVEDAREYITLAKSQFENSIRSFDGEPEEDSSLTNLSYQLRKIRRNVARKIEPDDYDRYESLQGLSDSALLRELKIHREGESERIALKSKNLILRKLFFLNESYFTDMPDASSCIEALQEALSEAEASARKLEGERDQSQNENVGKLIDLLVERSQKSPYTGIFGDISLDEEIFKVFTVLELRDMFESPIRAIPSVNDIMSGSVNSSRKGCDRGQITDCMILFGNAFGTRGRWAQKSCNPFCISREASQTLVTLMFQFVTKEMLKYGVCIGCPEYEKYVRITNEIDLLIQCSGSKKDSMRTFDVYNDDPRILTPDVQSFVKFCENGNGGVTNPYEEEKQQECCVHSHGPSSDEGPSGCGTQ